VAPPSSGSNLDPGDGGCFVGCVIPNGMNKCWGLHAEWQCHILEDLNILSWLYFIAGRCKGDPRGGIILDMLPLVSTFPGR
jgi:hypothetical protein